jgi:hypothetical protein
MQHAPGSMVSAELVAEDVVSVATAPIWTGPPGVPVHLLWDEVNPVPTTTVKKKQPKNKKGWGHTFVASEGASAEERRVSSITLKQLPLYQKHQVQHAVHAESAVEDVDMEEEDDDDKPLHVGRRNRRLLVADDDDDGS